MGPSELYMLHGCHCSSGKRSSLSSSLYFSFSGWLHCSSGSPSRTVEGTEAGDSGEEGSEVGL